MRLKTLSASSITTFEECPARFKAENVDFTPRSGSGDPAKLGTSVHNALEKYVELVYMTKQRPPEIKLLEMLYSMAFAEIFQTSDRTGALYKDGLKMIREWYNRHDLEDIEVQVLSVEKKESMPFKTSDGEKPLNFIWDRCDLIRRNGKTIIRVVDYKTIREYVTPEDLRQKIQARIYGMAAATKFKDMQPDEIWVEFDLLRYAPVSVVFSREENVATWKFIKETAERILAMEERNVPEQLSPGCRWCVRKTECRTLRRNVAGGGMFAATGEDLLAARYELDAQYKAIRSALGEIDDQLLRSAIEENILEWEEGAYRIKFSSRKSRDVDLDKAHAAIGPELAARFPNLGVGVVDELLKSDDLSDSQKSLLRGAITESWGEPRPKVTKLLFP